MTDTINGRTPEEIKKGLECCTDVCDEGCKTCVYDSPYNRRDKLCLVRLKIDALAYIQQLERERDEARSDLDTLNYAVTELHSAYDAMKRERDAAVERCVNAVDVSAGYYQEIQQLESAQPKWISVGKRKPKVGEFVLFQYAKNAQNPTMHARNTMAVGRYEYGMFLVEGCSVKVTHWMPLPEPPKENPQ